RYVLHFERVRLAAVREEDEYVRRARDEDVFEEIVLAAIHSCHRATGREPPTMQCKRHTLDVTAMAERDDDLLARDDLLDLDDSATLPVQDLRAAFVTKALDDLVQLFDHDRELLLLTAKQRLQFLDLLA